jgi:hypothetical protein
MFFRFFEFKETPSLFNNEQLDFYNKKFFFFVKLSSVDIKIGLVRRKY